MARWPDHPAVDLVTTDGFLYPLRVLEEKQLMSRKGFPESYDTRRMVQFLADVKAGQPEVTGAGLFAPVLRHRARSVAGRASSGRADLRGSERAAARPCRAESRRPAGIGDPLRFLRFFASTSTPARPTSRPGISIASGSCSARCSSSPTSYFHHYKDLGPEEARAAGRRIWSTINEVNLRKTSCRPVSGPTSCCTRRPTIRSRGSPCDKSRRAMPCASSRHYRRRICARSPAAQAIEADGLHRRQHAGEPARAVPRRWPSPAPRPSASSCTPASPSPSRARRWRWPMSAGISRRSTGGRVHWARLAGPGAQRAALLGAVDAAGAAHARIRPGGAGDLGGVEGRRQARLRGQALPLHPDDAELRARALSTAPPPRSASPPSARRC